MTRARDLADSADKDITGTLTVDAIDVQGTVTADGLTVDGDTQLGNTLSTGATISFASSGRNDSTDLFVDDAADDDFVIVNNRSTGDIALKTNQTESLRIGSNGDISFYDSTGTTQGFFWDASTQRLGLGTTSPSVKLHSYLASSGISGIGPNATALFENSGNSDIIIAAGATSSSRIAFGDSGDWIAGRIDYNHSDNSMRFGTNLAAEKMRLDASGNLLVGKSSVAGNVVGTEIRSNGRIQLSVDGDDALRLNRKNSDGDIQIFQKDGLEIGTIGAFGGDVYIGTGDTTLRFADGDDAVIPRGTNGATRDAAINLGISNNRFKDLYLGGGVYAGSGFGSNGQLLTSNGTTATWQDAPDGVKAWVNLNGTGTVAIRESQNVSSITDDGTGRYQVNFSTAFSDANYAALGTVSRDTNGGSAFANIAGHTNYDPVPTTTNFHLHANADDGSSRDKVYVYAAVFR